jgi:2-desacetyl-2-hydroxyethyl bacteriochlorophyllide A dehydrogenase
LKAAIYNGPKDVAVTEIPTPVPGPHDVLLRNLYAGICGSDVAAYLHGYQPDRITLGSEFGHEVVSEVAATGSAVQGIEVGDRVYPYPLLARGDPSRAGNIGGFSEYILIPDAQLGRQLYRVDEVIPLRVAAMVEPFTVGTRAARRSRPQPGESAIVFGAGTIGMAAAIALRRFGCSKVMVVDMSDFRLKKAAALGFATCNSSADDLTRKATEIFGAARSLDGTTPDVDIFIDATNGADAVIGTYQSVTKLFSRMVIVGVHAQPVPVNLAKLAFGWQEIIGSGGYMPEDVAFVLELMNAGEFDLESIVTHTFPLDEIVTALETASDPDLSLHVSIRC